MTLLKRSDRFRTRASIAETTLHDIQGCQCHVAAPYGFQSEERDFSQSGSRCKRLQAWSVSGKLTAIPFFPIQCGAPVMKSAAIVCSLLASVVLVDPLYADGRPNILWIFAEDTSPWMGCYGDPVNANGTPHIDALADRGVRFSRAFVPAPVCSACRSAMMVGQNQIRFGGHQHRSSRGPVEISLPDGITLLPQLMKQSGYYTFNLGKTDYNFVYDESASYSMLGNRRGPIPWETFRENQPFFGQIQTGGGKNNTSQFPAERKVDPSEVTVPADYPQNDLYRSVVAQHYDAIRMDDDLIGQLVGDLENYDLAENTIVVYFSDHGAPHLVRHKQMPTEGGLHVPFIISGPRSLVPGQQVRDDLVDLLDLSATTLAWAGIPIPNWYEGQHLFGEVVKPRVYIGAAKDRLDHTIDRVRSIRSDRYRYTRNFKTDRILLQPQYRDRQPYVQNLHTLYANGELSPTLAGIYFGERPAEELYDVRRDPHQVNNLVGDPAFSSVLDWHRERLDVWLASGDRGAEDEPAAELAFQAEGHKWGEGVNPEYEAVRVDSDGNGLSDAWERINGRDPQDGKLLFQFDCGGWQTEGWEPIGDLGNLAGRLGFLEFSLPDGRGSIVRDGLQLDSSRNLGTLLVRMRATTPVTVHWKARGEGTQRVGIGEPQELDPSDELVEVAFPLTPSHGWVGTIREVEIGLQGAPGTAVEIESIRVE